jgi:hypothetical protein
MLATADPAKAHIASIMNRILTDIVWLSPVNERMAWNYFQRLRERSFSVVEREGKWFLLMSVYGWSIAFCAIRELTNNPHFRSWEKVKFDFSRYDASFGRKPENITMPLFKYFGTVGSALLALMYVSDAYFGDDGAESRFNGSLYESAMYAPRLEDVVAAREIHFTRDVTPSARVKEVFAQFVPNEGRRVKR